MENKTWEEYCISQIPYLKQRWNLIMNNTPLDLVNPKRLTEKIQWLKIYDSTDLKTLCSDKIAVRQYCFDVLNKDYFIPILGIWKRFEDINFKILPKDYVLKTNHGSHTNLIVKNNKINKVAAKNNFDCWLAKDWTWWGAELAYKRIDRKIFAETYMHDGHDDLIDYKFLCFNGRPTFCQIIADRHNKNKRLNYYDMNFVPQKNISRTDFLANYNVIDPIPRNWDLMKEVATKLSKAFKFVRVDFYEINNTLYIGELTFFPGSGFIKYTDPTVDLRLGNILTL